MMILKSQNQAYEEQIFLLKELDLETSSQKLISEVGCQNSYTETVKGTGEKFVSTKRDKNTHGIGIKNAPKVARKYNGYMKINYDKELFSVELLIDL